MSSMKLNKGITLIELLVVLVIMAILGALAIPAYSNYTQKARRADARSALSSILLAQERYFTVNGKYIQGNSGSLFSTAAFKDDLDDKLSVSADGLTITSEKKYYRITVCQTAKTTDPKCTAPSDAGFQLRAIAQDAQENDLECYYMDMNHLGVKTSYEADDAKTTFTENTDAGPCW